MNKLQQQIIDTWAIHHRITMLLLSEIPEDALSATLSTRGGRDLARQLAHIHNVRVPRLKTFAKKNHGILVEFDPKSHPSKAELIQAFEKSGHWMQEYIADCLIQDAEVPNFKRNVVPMLGYYISHEAHHRGSILLTMKQCGFKISDALKWKIWEWNKI